MWKHTLSSPRIYHVDWPRILLECAWIMNWLTSLAQPLRKRHHLCLTQDTGLGSVYSWGFKPGSRATWNGWNGSTLWMHTKRPAQSSAVCDVSVMLTYYFWSSQQTRASHLSGICWESGLVRPLYLPPAWRWWWPNTIQQGSKRQPLGSRRLKRKGIDCVKGTKICIHACDDESPGCDLLWFYSPECQLLMPILRPVRLCCWIHGYKRGSNPLLSCIFMTIYYLFKGKEIKYWNSYLLPKESSQREDFHTLTISLHKTTTPVQALYQRPSRKSEKPSPYQALLEPTTTEVVIVR